MKALTAKLKIVGVFFLLSLFLCILIFSLMTRHGNRHIVIGGKNDTEQAILGEILAQLIEKNSDLRVVRRLNLDGTSICFHALLSNTIDLYFEYTGTAYLHILKQPLINAPLFPIVKEAFEKRYGLIWLDPLGYSNQYALITRSSEKLDNISDISKKTRVAFDPEFSVREESALLCKNYQMTSPSKLMDQMILYLSLLNGSVDVVSGWVTAAQLVDPRFKVLKDDDGVLPRYEVAPIIRQDTLKKFPELLPIIQLLKEAISEEDIRQMNHCVELRGKNVQGVAGEYINKNFSLKIP